MEIRIARDIFFNSVTLWTGHFAATPQSDVVRICAHDFQRHGDAFGTMFGITVFLQWTATQPAALFSTPKITSHGMAATSAVS